MLINALTCTDVNDQVLTCTYALGSNVFHARRITTEQLATRFGGLARPIRRAARSIREGDIGLAIRPDCTTELRQVTYPALSR
jgi:hypothetical protein